MKSNYFIRRNGHRSFMGEIPIGFSICGLFFFSTLNVQANFNHLTKSNLFNTQTYQQQSTIQGVILDDKGRGIPGVSVAIKGKSTKTLTSVTGQFSIKADNGDELIISHLSYQTKHVVITSNRILNIVLESLDNLIEEVTITGYTDYSKGKSPSSTSLVKAEDINQVPKSSFIEELLTGLGAPYGVAINHAEGKMYIADGANVSRANLDGTGYEKQFINIAGGAMRAIGYSTTANRIYFYEVNDEYMYIAKTDGTGIEELIEGAYGYGLCIDEVNEKIYYDDRRNTGLMRANLDGTNPVKIASFSGNRGGSGMAIDYDEEKIYWSETNLGNIKRANLDGTEPETVRSGLSNPRGMFVKH